MCDCNPITQFVIADAGCNVTVAGCNGAVQCRFTGLKPERIGCGCQGKDVFRTANNFRIVKVGCKDKRTCKLKNVQLRVAPECNTVDILAIERGTTLFELTPAPEPPLSVVVSGGGPPLSDAPRVFPTRGNFSSELNPIL